MLCLRKGAVLREGLCEEAQGGGARAVPCFKRATASRILANLIACGLIFQPPCSGAPTSNFSSEFSVLGNLLADLVERVPEPPATHLLLSFCYY